MRATSQGVPGVRVGRRQFLRASQRRRDDPGITTTANATPIDQSNDKRDKRQSQNSCSTVDTCGAARRLFFFCEDLTAPDDDADDADAAPVSAPAPASRAAAPPPASLPCPPPPAAALPPPPVEPARLPPPPPPPLLSPLVRAVSVPSLPSAVPEKSSQSKASSRDLGSRRGVI